MMKKALLLAALFLGFAGLAQAKDGYKISVKFTDLKLKDSLVYLAHYFGKPLPTIYKADSAKFDKNNVATFESKDPEIGGIYIVLLADHKTYFEFLLTNGDEFSITANSKELPTGLEFKGSPENERFVAYRDWLLRTPLSDALLGRVWEYIWQYIFTGHNVYCPIQHVCSCDGFGICFGSEEKYKAWTDLRFTQLGYEYELRDWHDKEKLVQQSMEDGTFDELAELDIPEVGRDVWLEEEIERIKQDLKQRRDAAIERGNDPRIRAQDSGREWKEGDWF